MQAKIVILLLAGLILFSSLATANQPNSVKVKKGKTFELSVEQALNPKYEWLCTSYDKEYLKFLGERHTEVSDKGLVGVTKKIFEFKAIKVGDTEVVLNYCRLDQENQPIEVLRTRSYSVEIEASGGFCLPLSF
jgi:predicted secreted protein